MQYPEIQGTVWSRQISVCIPSRTRHPCNTFSLGIIVASGVEHHRTKDCPGPSFNCVVLKKFLVKVLALLEPQGSAVPGCLSVNDEGTSRSPGLSVLCLTKLTQEIVAGI